MYNCHDPQNGPSGGGGGGGVVGFHHSGGIDAPESIDLELFEQTSLSSSLFSSPTPTVDGYANQIETELTSILDKVAPLKTGHRTGPRKAKNWLSPETFDAKKRRRRLERRWKASNAKPDRLAYRALLARLQTS